MTETVAVILAAGRGSRMNDLTNTIPKCLLPLAGKPLLHWQLEALRAAGMKRIAVVRGYQAERVTGDFETIDNPLWASTNMVQSLLCGFERFPESHLLVSYSDIVYRPDHIRVLLDCKVDIAITYDVAWQDLWGARNENPLDDAETFRAANGLLQDIGRKPDSLKDVQGQYMGLLRFSPVGAARAVEYVHALSSEQKNKLDMTSLLRGLLHGGMPIGAVPVSGGWCECDTEKDIHLYEQKITEERWHHDWRTS